MRDFRIFIDAATLKQVGEWFPRLDSRGNFRIFIDAATLKPPVREVDYLLGAAISASL